MTGARRVSRIVTALLVAATAGCLPDLDGRQARDYRVVAGGEAREGPGAMRAYGCGSCHTIPGVRGASSLVGPPLAGWKGRRFIAGRVPNEPETLVRWIIHPQGIKPGTAMPDLGVSGQDARNIAAYLYTLE